MATSGLLELPITMPNENQPPRDRVDLRADPAWIARVQKQADRLGIALSAYIRLATSERLERDEESMPKKKRS